MQFIPKQRRIDFCNVHGPIARDCGRYNLCTLPSTIAALSPINHITTTWHLNTNHLTAQQIGGPNGLTPFGTTLFFVADEPTVPHARVAAHEIGHILGLYHTWKDQGRLLYPGTDGTELSEEEIFVARYAARGLIEEQR